MIAHTHIFIARTSAASVSTVVCFKGQAGSLSGCLFDSLELAIGCGFLEHSYKFIHEFTNHTHTHYIEQLAKTKEKP